MNLYGINTSQGFRILQKGPDNNRMKTGAIMNVVGLESLLWVFKRGSEKNRWLLRDQRVFPFQFLVLLACLSCVYDSPSPPMTDGEWIGGRGGGRGVGRGGGWW